MTTGAGSLSAGVDEKEAPGVETGAGLATTGTGVIVGTVVGAVMPVAGVEMAGMTGMTGVEMAGTGIGAGAEAAGLAAAGAAPGFAAVGSGVLVKEAGLAGWLLGALAGAP